MTGAQLRKALEREYAAGGARRTRALAIARRLQAAAHQRALRPSPAPRPRPSPLVGIAAMGLDAVAPGLGSIGLPIFNAIVPDFFNIGNPDYAAMIAQGIAHQKADPEYAAKVQANIEAAQVSPIEPRGTGGGRAVRQ